MTQADGPASALGRRAALQLSAAAAGGLLAGCRNGVLTGESEPGRRPRAGRARPSQGIRAGSSVPLPAPGDLYFGASVPYYRSLSAWEAELGVPLALNRSFFQPDEIGKLSSQCAIDLRRGRLPHVSIKPPDSWSAVAAGRRDYWLADLLGGLSVRTGPVFLSVHHEPENDSGAPGMMAQDFVAMQVRIVEKARELAPNVTVVPVLQQWTFDPTRTDIEPGRWVVEEADVFGLDLYNPWSPTNGKPWRTFSSKLSEAAPWIGDKPVAIGEYGCRVDPSVPGRAAEWLRDAVASARSNRVVSMAYFSSSVNSRYGGFDLRGELERTFARLLRSPWVARPHSSDQA